MLLNMLCFFVNEQFIKYTNFYEGTRLVSDFLKSTCGAGQLASWLRGLAALPEEQGQFPGAHTAAHSHLKLQF